MVGYVNRPARNKSYRGRYGCPKNLLVRIVDWTGGRRCDLNATGPTKVGLQSRGKKLSHTATPSTRLPIRDAERALGTQQNLLASRSARRGSARSPLRGSAFSSFFL